MLRSNATVEFIWKDASGSQAVTMLNFPSTTEAVEAAASANALVAVFGVLSDAVLMGLRIKYTAQILPYGSVSTGGSVMHSGVIYLATTDDNPDTEITIPGIKNSLIESEGPFAGYRIDGEMFEITDLVDALVSMGATNPFADAITSYVIGYLQSRA